MRAPLWLCLFLLLLTRGALASLTHPNLGATTDPATKCARTMTLLALVDCRSHRLFRLIHRARPLTPEEAQPPMM